MIVTWLTASHSLASGADQPDRRVDLLAVGVDVADAPEPLGQVVVDPVVLGDRVVRLRRQDLRMRLQQVLRRHGRVERAHRLQQAPGDDELLPRLALLSPWRDVLAGQWFPAELTEYVERQLLPLLLRHPVLGHVESSP